MYACENLEIWDICIQCIHMVCDDVAITPLRSSGQLKSRAGSITVKCRTIDEISCQWNIFMEVSTGYLPIIHF